MTDLRTILKYKVYTHIITRSLDILQKEGLMYKSGIKRVALHPDYAEYLLVKFPAVDDSYIHFTFDSSLTGLRINNKEYPLWKS